MSDTAYHYTKVFNLPRVFRDGFLLPSPPLASYGLCREDVEADPGRFGFKVSNWLSGNRPDQYHNGRKQLRCDAERGDTKWTSNQGSPIPPTRPMPNGLFWSPYSWPS